MLILSEALVKSNRKTNSGPVGVKEVEPGHT